MKHGKTAPSDLSPPPRYTETDQVNDTGDDVDYGKPYVFEPDFSGPINKRSCTDVICLLLFLAFLGGWAFIAAFGIMNGDISKVLYPTDSRGDICGQGELEDRPFLLFFDLTRCINPAVVSLGCPTPQTCVKECPSLTTSFYSKAKLAKNVLSEMRPYCFPMTNQKFQSMTSRQLIESGLCPAWVIESKPFLGRCLPSLSINTDDNSTVISNEGTTNNKGINKGTLKYAMGALSAFLNVRNIGERIFNDLKDSWYIVGIGLILATILSFLWIILMRFMAGLMVWLSIGLSAMLFGGLFGYSLYRFFVIKNEGDAESEKNIFQVNFTSDYLHDVLGLRNTWLAFTIILGIILAIIFLVLIALRQRIQIAIQLIEQGAKAAGQMCSTFLFPIIPFLLHLVVLCWFTVIALYLSSAGTKIYTINYDHDDIGNLTASRLQRDYLRFHLLLKNVLVIIIVSIQKRKYLTNWKMNAHQKFLMILANLAPLLFANLQSMKKEETG